MARITGPGGLVTGVDFDPQIVELARQDATDAGAGNIEYHIANARVFDGGPFDLIYAPVLLSHLSQAGTVLARMRQLARPAEREFGPGRIARPYRDVRFRAGKAPYKTAACSASCGRVDGRLDVHHRRPVDCLQSVDFNPEPVARHDAGTVQADGVRPIG
jgi:hypothetical protein